MDLNIFFHLGLGPNYYIFFPFVGGKKCDWIYKGSQYEESHF